MEETGSTDLGKAQSLQEGRDRSLIGQVIEIRSAQPEATNHGWEEARLQVWQKLRTIKTGDEVQNQHSEAEWYQDGTHKTEVGKDMDENRLLKGLEKEAKQWAK